MQVAGGVVQDGATAWCMDGGCTGRVPRKRRIDWVGTYMGMYTGLLLGKYPCFLAQNTGILPLEWPFGLEIGLFYL